MQHSKWTAAAFAVLASCGSVWAQEQTEVRIERREGRRPWAEQARRWQKANDLLGKAVTLSSGDEVGKVNDMIVDIDSGRVIYYVITFERKYVALPTLAMDLPDDTSKFRLNVNKDQLQANAFEKDRYPDFGERTWAVRIHTQFNQKPYWENPESATGKGARAAEIWFSYVRHWLKATDIIGKSVTNRQNENLGKIEDLSVDPDSGRILYAVLSFGGFLGMGDKYFALPWKALDLTSEAKKFVLDVDKQRLKNASGFDKKSWPNLADSRWGKDIYTFYGQKPYWEDTD